MSVLAQNQQSTFNNETILKITRISLQNIFKFTLIFNFYIQVSMGSQQYFLLKTILIIGMNQVNLRSRCQLINCKQRRQNRVSRGHLDIFYRNVATNEQV